MDKAQIFLPVLAQISLTLIIFVAYTFVKIKALKDGEVDQNKRALYADAWPDYVVKFSNNIANQFETPVLFYALCFMLWALNVVSALAIIVAWGYVATRIVHAYIHTGSNYVPHRKRIFMFGCVCLFILTALCFTAVF
jgi:hypothetical protein